MSVFINPMGYNSDTIKMYKFKKCKDITNIELLVYKIKEYTEKNTVLFIKYKLYKGFSRTHTPNKVCPRSLPF